MSFRKNPDPIARSSWAARAAVASRVLAAVAGGYALAAVSAMALALFLPLTRVEATVTATLLSFVVYTAAALWAFAATSATRAWAGIGGPALALAALVFLAGKAA